MNRKLTGLAAISFLFSIAGIVISALLLKEDVTSTAHTIFEYFPLTYSVTPSSTWEGAIILGVFTSVLQVVAANVAFSNKFAVSSRVVAFVSLVASCVFDNWTDIVFRSGNLTGNLPVAFVTTLAFYTLGSEITQGLSWLVFIATWRPAISDVMLASTRAIAGFQSIKSEWNSLKRSSYFKENSERGVNRPLNQNQGQNNQNQGNQKKIHSFQPISEDIRRKIAAGQGKSEQNHPIRAFYPQKDKKN